MRCPAGGMRFGCCTPAYGIQHATHLRLPSALSSTHNRQKLWELTVFGFDASEAPAPESADAATGATGLAESRTARWANIRKRVSTALPSASLGPVPPARHSHTPPEGPPGQAQGLTAPLHQWRDGILPQLPFESGSGGERWCAHNLPRMASWPEGGESAHPRHHSRRRHRTQHIYWYCESFGRTTLVQVCRLLVTLLRNGEAASYRGPPSCRLSRSNLAYSQSNVRGLWSSSSAGLCLINCSHQARGGLVRVVVRRLCSHQRRHHVNTAAKSAPRSWQGQPPRGG